MTDAPTIDFRRIDFPSDSLTVGTLRRLFPDRFDADPNPSFFSRALSAGGPDHADDAVGEMLYLERSLAQSAFARAVGDEHSDRSLEPESRDNFAADLAGYYVRYGIAPGKAAAEQLIRSIESQAVAQAASHGGRPPGPAR